jgi:hypothetical protein
MKKTPIYLVILLFMPSLILGQTIEEVIMQHDSIQLSIDQKIATGRERKLIDSSEAESIKNSLAELRRTLSFPGLEPSTSSKYISNLSSLNKIFIENTTNLLESAKGKAYSDNAILAFEYASNRLFMAKLRWTDLITRDSVFYNKSRIDTTYQISKEVKELSKNIKNTVKKIPEPIIKKTDIVKKALSKQVAKVDSMVTILQPKRNLSNYLIQTGIIFPDEKQGGLIGAYVRFKGDFYAGLNAIFITLDEGRSVTAMQAGLNWDFSNSFFVNIHTGPTWGEYSTLDWTSSLGGGVIFESKSYWNPRVGIQAHFGNLKGVSLQVVLPVGVKYPDCKDCKNCKNCKNCKK